MTRAYSGFPAYLQVDNGGYTTVAAVRDITGPAEAQSTIDVSTRDAEERDFVAGMIDGGELTFDIVYDPDTNTHKAAAAPGLRYYLENRTLKTWKLWYADRPTPDVTIDSTTTGGTGVNEVQTISLVGDATGGTYTLTFDGQTTGALAYNVSAADMQTALRALSSIDGANVTVTGSAGGPYTVTFIGTLAETNVVTITATSSLTDAACPSVVFSAYVTKFAPKTPIEGAQAADLTLRITGALTWA